MKIEDGIYKIEEVKCWRKMDLKGSANNVKHNKTKLKRFFFFQSFFF